MKSKRIVNATKIDIPIAELGYPGAIGEIFFIEDFDDNNKEDKDRLNDRVPRKFFLKCIIDKNSIIPNGIKFDSTKDDGNSFLLVNPEMAVGKIEVYDCLIEFYKNMNNEISMFTSKFISDSIENALINFLKLITPFIDHLSFLSNVPIHIQKIIGEDITNRITFSFHPIPYQMIGAKFSQEYIPSEMIPIFSLYREAKNNHSQYYKFLCFYKILEGLYSIRDLLMQKAKKNHIIINIQKDLVPNHDALENHHNQYIGKSINKIFKGYFHKEFRVAIAHFKKFGDKPFNISDYKTIKYIADNVVLIDICCREVINSQMDLFKQISTN